MRVRAVARNGVLVVGCLLTLLVLASPALAVKKTDFLAGYQATLISGNQSVSANFIVPTVSCPATGNRGLVLSVALAQADETPTSEGALFVSCQQGMRQITPVAFAGQSSCSGTDPVDPADHMSVSVVRTGSDVLVTLTNSTKPWQETCNGIANTIDTRASIGVQDLNLEPLAKFSQFRYTGVRVSGATLGSRPHTRYTKTGPTGTVQAVAGAISSNGLAFTMTWKHQ
jgi:hypothetical protein